MGDWRTVNITGHMNPEEAKRMIEELSSESIWYTAAWGFHIHYSLCGLNQWVKSDGKVFGAGNLAERDCEIEDIKAGLEYLVESYPSLNLILHAGGNYESEECVATFIVRNGVVEQTEPQVDKISMR